MRRATTQTPKASEIKPNTFQAACLALPVFAQGRSPLHVALPGSRGGGKTFAVLLLAWQHLQRYGSNASLLYLRRTFPALQEFEREAVSFFFGVCPGVEFNRMDGVFRFPGGGIFRMSQVETDVQVQRFLGASLTLLIADEVTHWPSPRLIDSIRSSLRGPDAIAKQVILAANPGGAGHHWVRKRHVAGRSPGVPYELEPGDWWVTLPSTFRGNPHIGEADQYERSLRMATMDDPGKRAGWIDGDWDALSGDFFAYVLDERRNALSGIEPGRLHLGSQRWPAWLGHDWGSARPSVTYLCTSVPGGGVAMEGRYFPAGSVLVLDEVATTHPDDPAVGLRFTVPEVAEEILAMVDQWGASATGYADDACWIEGSGPGSSIAAEFSRCRVHFRRAGKGRRAQGWEKLRRLMAGAGDIDRPGLYVSTRCRYFWETVPVLQGNPANPEDLLKNSIDHAADAIRYALAGSGRPVLSVQELL